MALVGTPTLRTEDPRLLAGGARYVANLDLPGCLHVTYVTSTGRTPSCGRSSRGGPAAPGVVDVVTAADLDIGP